MKTILSLICAAFLIASCTKNNKSSSADPREINGMKFSSMKLKNDLEVMVISDPRFKKSAAALAVGVGSLADPNEAQGLAHYLEHMLFMGTKKYPAHDEYRDFIEKNGGYSNAYTADEITNYLFEIDTGAYKEALDRFAQFFISPLLDERYLEKEKNAVNSEFDRNIEKDHWRLYRMSTVIAKKEHPYNTFNIGSNKTLKDVKRKDVLEFYKKYYSADNMKLVLVSSKPIDELKKLARTNFNSVPKFKYQKNEYDFQYFNKNEQPQITFIQSIQDRYILQVFFNTPDYVDYWQSKPTLMLAYLLGDESEGSLLSYLKEKGWALKLSASPEVHWRDFGFNLTLTKKGRENYQQVVQAIFAAIELVKEKGYPKYVFEDNQEIARLELENLEASGGAGMASSFAAKIMDYPVDEVIDRSFLIEKYSKEDFETFLSYLRKDNAHIFVASQNEKTDQTEKPFGIKYRTTNFKAPLDDKALAPLKKQMALPKQNPFIARSFDLVNSDKTQSEAQTLTENGFKLHVQTDTELGIPKTYLDTYFQSAIENNPKNYLLSSLYAKCKEEELREWAYPALTAGYSYSISSVFGDKMAVSVSGFSEKIDLLLTTILEDSEKKREISQCQIDEKRLDQIKDKMLLDLSNFKKMEAFRRLMLESQIVSVDKEIHWEQYKNMVASVSLKDLNQFGKDFFNKVFVEVVASGNITSKGVKALAQNISTSLEAELLSLKKAEAQNRQFVLPPKSKEVAYKLSGNNNNNAMMTSYYLKDWNINDHAHLMVLGKLISPAYFSELRSNQQLGYVVFSFPNLDSGYIGFNGLIQSQNHKASYLKGQSDKFVENFVSDLSGKLTDKDLEPVIAALVNELEKKATVLAQRHSKFKKLALQYNGHFSMEKDLIAAVKNMKASDLKEFMKSSFMQDKVGRLTYYYLGQNSHKENKTLDGEVITSPNATADWVKKDPYKSVGNMDNPST